MEQRDALLGTIQQLLQHYLPDAPGVLLLNASPPHLLLSWGLTADAATALAATAPIPSATVHAYPFQQGAVSGTLIVQPAAPPNEQDALYLRAISTQLGLLLATHAPPSSSNHLSATTSDLDTLIELASITTRHLPTLLHQTATLIAERLPADTVQIGILPSDIEAQGLLYDSTSARTRPAPANPPATSELAQLLASRTPQQWHSNNGTAYGGAPLRVSPYHTIGYIQIGRQTASFSPTDLHRLERTAHQLAASIHSIALQNQIEEQILQLSLLNFVSAVAASGVETQDFYYAAIEAMVQITGADQARLFLSQPATEHFVPVSAYIPTDDECAVTLTANCAPLVWLEQYRTPLASSNATSDPRLAPLHNHFAHQYVASAVLVPLILSDSVLGFVCLSFNVPQPYFKMTHLDYCQTLANTVVTVIAKQQLFSDAQHNAEALQVKVGELSTLLEAAGILGALLRPNEVLESLIDLVRRQLQVITVALWTIGNDQILTPIAIHGIAEEALHAMRVPIGQGLTGQVALTGQPLRILNVPSHGGALYNDIRTSDGRSDPLTSYMGVPLFYRDEVIGVLSVMSAEERAFTEDEMLLLVALGRQAAIALENARLFQERERRINQLSAINQISADVNATLNLDELLLTLQRGIGSIIDTSQSYIGLFADTALDVSEYTVQLRVIQQGSEPRISNDSVVIDGSGLIDYVMLRSEPLLLETPAAIEAHLADWAAQYGIQPAAMRRSPMGTSFQSMLAVPIMQGRDLQGIIGIESTRPYAFTNDDLQFLSTVGSQAAAGIAGARLLQERERRLREMSILKDIGSGLSSTLDLQAVLTRLRYELGQAIDMSTSIIALYEEATETLSYPVAFDHNNPISLAPSALGNDVNGWVIRNRQPLLLLSAEQAYQIGFDVHSLSLFEIRSAQTGQLVGGSRVPQSLLVVPILSSDTVLGVINIQSDTPRAFDNDDLRFVSTVANQVAATIANVTLFIERGRRLEELAIFNAIGRELSSTVSSEELTALIHRQTGRLLDARNFYIARIDEAHQMITFPLFYERGEQRQIAPILLHQPTNSTARYPAIFRWPVIERLTRTALRNPEPLLVQGDDLINGGWLVELPSELQVARRKKPFSWLGVPLIVGDHVTGLIALFSHENNLAYTGDDIRLLSTIASSAAIALENARLFEQISNLATELEQRVDERTRELASANAQLIEEKESLETVHAITLELTASLNLNEIIERALEMASTNLMVSRGSIMLRDTQSGELFCRALLQDQGLVSRVNIPITFTGGDSLAHWVVTNSESAIIGNVLDDPRWKYEEGRAEETRSVIAVPLQTSDHTLGVLMLNSPRTNYFTESQLRLLETVASEIAIAINNAQLYDYITDMATQLSFKMDEEKLANSKNEAVFQSMTEGVIVLDQHGQIDAFNLATEQMLGIPASFVLKQPLDIIATYGDTEETLERGKIILDTLRTGLQTAKDRNDIFRTTFELRNPTQTISISLSTIQARDGSTYGDVAVLRDITLEIEADRAKRQFVSDVSHELRTPLTAIKGYVDLLLMGTGGPLNEQQLELMEVVKANVRRLKALVDDILEISRFEAGKIELTFQPVNVATIIRDVAQTLRLEAERKHMHITIEVQPDLPSVIADEKRLTQVITNLYSNAIKYTYEGGTITVRAFLNQANLLQFEIEDNGVGMSPGQLKKLFRPFYRAFNPLSEQAGGTGLGLLITKSLVEQHGGEMWVTSTEGKGSTFSFVLPLEQPNLMQHAAAEEDSA